MGGGARFPYPSWVWTYHGGWWTRPQHALRNSFIMGSVILTFAGVAFNYSTETERRHRYPNGWIPSMLWSKEFHDPKFVAFWKEQLAKEGREWIEPIPSWWPFKKSSE